MKIHNNPGSPAPKMVRRVLTTASVGVLMLGGLLTGSAPASASQRLGGVDMQRACNVQYGEQFGYKAEVRNQWSAYSWRCTKPWDMDSKGIDVHAACIDQYGNGAYQGLGSRWNPYSWYCQR